MSVEVVGIEDDIVRETPQACQVGAPKALVSEDAVDDSG